MEDDPTRWRVDCQDCIWIRQSCSMLIMYNGSRHAETRKHNVDFLDKGSLVTTLRPIARIETPDIPPF